MSQANDFDGARRLGRRALLFSIMAIAVGLSIILYLAITGKYTNTYKYTPIPHTTSVYHLSIALSLSVSRRELM